MIWLFFSRFRFSCFFAKISHFYPQRISPFTKCNNATQSSYVPHHSSTVYNRLMVGLLCYERSCTLIYSCHLMNLTQYELELCEVMFLRVPSIELPIFSFIIPTIIDMFPFEWIHFRFSANPIFMPFPAIRFQFCFYNKM